jgi:ADP-L-glycero-D-manno-heptose 6-epimerase
MILVTGGAGFIGSALVWRLNQEGFGDIVVADRMGDGPKWRNLAKRQIRRIINKNDLFSWLSEDSVASSIEAVFHMGASSSTVITDVDYLVANNLDYSIRLWQFCAKQKIPFIYASSASTYGDGKVGFDDAQSGSEKLVPLNPYGFSKQKFDAFALNHAEDKPPFWAGLKFFNVYGPNEYHKGNQSSVIHQFVPQVKTTGKINLFKSHRNDYADGEQKRDFVYVKDCVDVMWHLFRNQASARSGVYNVGSGQARTFHDLAVAVFKAMDTPVSIDMVPMPKNLREHYQYFTEADLARLRSETGYEQNPTLLEDGVNDYVREYLLKDDPYL